MFPIQRNWLKVEQSDKLIRRRLSSECSKSSVSTRSLISQMNDILLPSALLPLNTMVSLEQAANFELDCCKAHSHAKKKQIFATINCGWFGFHQLGDTQMQSPTRFGHSEQFLGGWVVLVLRGLGVVAHF